MFRRPVDLLPSDFPIKHRSKAADILQIEPLIGLCNSGRLYEVERWISEGHAIQFTPPTDRKLQRRQTPLQIAVSRGFHSLAALLLTNGYAPNGDYYECLSPAVRSRDLDMIDLLLKFGADPSSCDFAEVLETYNRPIMDRFIAAGVDPCANNSVAKALRHKTRPLLGFVKTYWDRFPGLQHQIDIALHSFVDSKDEKGVALMLWLGANPYSITPSSPYPEEGSGFGDCAMESALWSNHPGIIKALMRRPIPPERVTPLLLTASYRGCPEIVRELLAAGGDPNAKTEEGTPLLESFVTTLAWRFGGDEPDRDARGLEALELVLAAGAKMQPTPRHLAHLRRSLLHGRGSTVAKTIELLGKYGGLSASEIHDLTRTPAMKRHIAAYVDPRPIGMVARVPSSNGTVGSRSGYWKRPWHRR